MAINTKLPERKTYQKREQFSKPARSGLQSKYVFMAFSGGAKSSATPPLTQFSLISGC